MLILRGILNRNRNRTFCILSSAGIFLACNLCAFNVNNVQAATDNDMQNLLNQNTNVLLNEKIATQTNTIMPIAATFSYSGVNGTASWDIDDEGKLTIHPGTLANGQGNWKPYADSIKSIYVEPGVTSTSDYTTGNGGLFAGLKNVTKIDVTNLDVSRARSLSNFFYGDRSLTEIIGLETWDTSLVGAMNNMFESDSSLKNLDLSNFDTSSTSNFDRMFWGCSSLEYLNITRFNTSKATSLNSTFVSVPGKIIGLKDLDVGKVTSMINTFSGVDFTKTDPNDIRDWNVSNVEDMSGLFQNSNLSGLDLSQWNVKEVKNMSNMFQGSENVSQVKGLNDWDVSGVTKMNSMFQSVKDTDLSMIENWDVSNVTGMSMMFYNCGNLSRLDLSHWSTDSLSSVVEMFYNDVLLNEDNLKGYQTLVTRKVESMSGMFFGTGFKVIDLSKYDTSNVKSFHYLFMSTSKLEKIIGNLDTSSVTDMSSMFNASAITNFDGLNIAEWDTSKVTNMERTFSGAKILNFDFLKDWNTSSVTTLESTFRSAKAKTIPLEKWDVSKVEKFYMTFQGASGLESLPIENWDVSSATTMYEMFFEASSLKKLDFSKWNTSKVTNFYAMLNKMSNLETVDLSGLDTTNATDMDYFFGLNYNLWKITLGPKSVMKNLQGEPTDVRFPTPVAGTQINDVSTSETYSAISNKWQIVDYASGGSDHEPVGDLMSAKEIVEQFSNVGNPVTTYVWQQQPIINIKMQVPDIDFGSINLSSQVFHRKNKDFAIAIDNNNYPSGGVKSTIAVSMDKPLTTSSGDILNNTLIYREKGQGKQILSEKPTQIYDDVLPDGTSSINWDEDSGILLDMGNEPYAKSGSYSTTLNWTLTNSI